MHQATIDKNIYNTSTLTSQFESFSPAKSRIHQQTHSVETKSPSFRRSSKAQKVDPNERLPTKVLVRKVMIRKAKTRLEKIFAKYDHINAEGEIKPAEAYQTQQSKRHGNAVFTNQSGSKSKEQKQGSTFS